VLTDAEIVGRIAGWLAGQPADHMLGLKVRLLFEDRADQAARSDDAAEVQPPAHETRD
jgi:hypothetical protein